MFIALGFLRTPHAEGFILQSELRCCRASRTVTAFILKNTHETLSVKAEKYLFCILGTFIVSRTIRADTHVLIFLHRFCHFCPVTFLSRLSSSVQICPCFSPLFFTVNDCSPFHPLRQSDFGTKNFLFHPAMVVSGLTCSFLPDYSMAIFPFGSFADFFR